MYYSIVLYLLLYNATSCALYKFVAYLIVYHVVFVCQYVCLSVCACLLNQAGAPGFLKSLSLHECMRVYVCVRPLGYK